MQIEKFIESIGGMSPNTVRNYEQTLLQLEALIDGKEPTDDEIVKFLNSYTSSSLHRHKAAIKIYLEFRGVPWRLSRRQFAIRKRKVPRYVRVETVRKIIEAADNEDDRMFVNTLFTLGCRINELMIIEGRKIGKKGIRVTVKGGNEKLKPTTADFNTEITRFARGKEGRIFPMTYSYYYSKLKELALKAGHPGVTPHMLRHARAVDLLSKGMPLPFVQQFLGHTSINTTAIYLEITGGELTEELEKVDRRNDKNA